MKFRSQGPNSIVKKQTEKPTENPTEIQFWFCDMSKLPIFGLFLSVGNLSWVFSQVFSWFFSRVFVYWIRPQHLDHDDVVLSLCSLVMNCLWEWPFSIRIRTAWKLLPSCECAGPWDFSHNIDNCQCNLLQKTQPNLPRNEQIAILKSYNTDPNILVKLHRQPCECWKLRGRH